MAGLSAAGYRGAAVLGVGVVERKEAMMPSLKPTEAWAVVDGGGVVTRYGKIEVHATEDQAHDRSWKTAEIPRRVVIVDAEQWERLKRKVGE